MSYSRSCMLLAGRTVCALLSATAPLTVIIYGTVEFFICRFLQKLAFDFSA